MTTNIFCKGNNTLASDSRWSFLVRDGERLVSTTAIGYIDNTGYDKIVYDEDTGFVFAGNGPLIDQWRQWVLNGNVLTPRPPVATDFAVCMTDLENSNIIFDHGQKVRHDDCRTAGTGAHPAYDCWNVNKDAKRAVISASAVDPMSGGEVKYLVGSSRQHNLDFSTSFDSIAEQFLQKGMVMYMNSQIPIPLDKAAVNDPRIEHLRNNVAKGAITAVAPSGYDPVVWTPSDEARLDAALAERAARRQARKTAPK